uniref:Peptidase_M13_N domain-containing protein n=1 Tax=Steinernema glaseri TaxID=37863 RepID=A0A1I7YHF4_9BILA
RDGVRNGEHDRSDEERPPEGLAIQVVFIYPGQLQEAARSGCGAAWRSTSQGFMATTLSVIDHRTSGSDMSVDLRDSTSDSAKIDRTRSSLATTTVVSFFVDKRHKHKNIILWPCWLSLLAFVVSFSGSPSSPVRTRTNLETLGAPPSVTHALQVLPKVPEEAEDFCFDAFDGCG